ncbi:MAG TPA: hypothetical protein VE890_13785 [Thermoguttaceae bacterium]|nr:hypothetical protein [Thermoguttaceae bacterium]
MPVYVIAKAGREFLDTPVFHAGPSGSEEAIAVFTDRDSADQYINEAGWSDHEVGELTSLQLLQWMVKAHGDGTRLLAVNPDRTGQLAGKRQVVVTIEEQLTQIANSLCRDVLGD